MSTAGIIVDRGLEGVVVGSTMLSNVEGEIGRLTYRGFDIHDLAPTATFEEICHLLLFGALPTAHQLEDLRVRFAANRSAPKELIAWLGSVPKDAAPMSVLRTMISALALFAPHLEGGGHASNPRAAIALIAKTPTLVAAWNRMRRGLQPIEPLPHLSTAANFLYMCSGRAPIYEAERALDTYLVLLADHSYNASTFAARVTASTRADIYASAVSAIATLEGDLHGGAPSKVMKMILEIERSEGADAYVRDLLARGEKIMGMGHREYKVRDPRATHLEAMAKALAEASGTKWYGVARALEEAATVALTETKPGRRIFANVEFYTAPTLYSLGLAPDEFTCMFACGRMAGWTAHVLEQSGDNRLIRPQATYTGPGPSKFEPLERRGRGERPAAGL
jgi:citrate synthase